MADQQYIRKQSSFYLQPDEEDRLQQHQESNEADQEKNEGNLIIFSKRPVHLSVGPDYPFSIVALLFMLGIAFGVIWLESNIGFKRVGKTINYLFAFLPCSSFLMTVLKNPGVYDADNNDEPKRTYCNICKVFKPKKVHHCEKCNICIEQFDHHCPWMSKCIGKKNLTWFYVFIASIPLEFCYFLFLIYTLTSRKG